MLLSLIAVYLSGPGPPPGGTEFIGLYRSSTSDSSRPIVIRPLTRPHLPQPPPSTGPTPASYLAFLDGGGKPSASASAAAAAKAAAAVPYNRIMNFVAPRGHGSYDVRVFWDDDAHAPPVGRSLPLQVVVQGRDVTEAVTYIHAALLDVMGEVKLLSAAAVDEAKGYTGNAASVYAVATGQHAQAQQGQAGTQRWWAEQQAAAAAAARSMRAGGAPGGTSAVSVTTAAQQQPNGYGSGGGGAALAANSDAVAAELAGLCPPTGAAKAWTFYQSRYDAGQRLQVPSTPAPPLPPPSATTATITAAATPLDLFASISVSDIVRVSHTLAQMRSLLAQIAWIPMTLPGMGGPTPYVKQAYHYQHHHQQGGGADAYTTTASTSALVPDAEAAEAVWCALRDARFCVLLVSTALHASIKKVLLLGGEAAGASSSPVGGGDVTEGSDAIVPAGTTSSTASTTAMVSSSVAAAASSPEVLLELDWSGDVPIQALLTAGTPATAPPNSGGGGDVSGGDVTGGGLAEATRNDPLSLAIKSVAARSSPTSAAQSFSGLASRLVAAQVRSRGGALVAGRT